MREGRRICFHIPTQERGCLEACASRSCLLPVSCVYAEGSSCAVSGLLNEKSHGLFTRLIEVQFLMDAACLKNSNNNKRKLCSIGGCTELKCTTGDMSVKSPWTKLGEE